MPSSSWTRSTSGGSCPRAVPLHERYGDGDFGKSLCTAVNCGDDTDCTGATLGSIFGILYGTRGIPEQWSKPIGTKIKTMAIQGFQHPQDLKELTERTVGMAKRVLEINDAPVAITDGRTDVRRASELKLAEPAVARALWSRSPYEIVWNERDMQVILNYVNEPVIAANSSHPLRVTVQNRGGERKDFQLSLTGLPQGWQLTGLPTSPVAINRNRSANYSLNVTAGPVEPQSYRMNLEATAGSRTVSIPVTLIGHVAKSKAIP